MRKALLLGLLVGLVGVMCGPVGSVWAAGDANMASCPNEALEGFREYLPDCRGYELVTPSFRDGGASGGLDGVSEDGSRLLMNSLGVFAGSQDDVGQPGAFYVLSRSGSGWMPEAIGPSQALFPAQEFKGASSDLKRSLWFMHSASQSITAEDAYVREADGSFVKIGPLVAPAAETGPTPPGGSYQAPFYLLYLNYVGGSSDLSHVLFTLGSFLGEKGALWPGDTTIPNESSARVYSLYEYVGVGNSHPSLVGVDGEGHLISDCSTTLGGPQEEDLYNAVSESGETVFFTATGDGLVPSSRHEEERSCYIEVAQHPGTRAPVVTELYARLGQFPIDTVSVSEPTESACEQCQTGVASLRHPAVVEKPGEFEGASQDGSKVFFLSEQELFAGAQGMNLWEYDFDNPSGQKVVRVSTGAVEPGVVGVARVSEDGSHVYFVAQGVLTEGVNGEGRAPMEGGDNLYVFERDASYPAGHLGFVATLSPQDREDWGERDERRAQATPDGRFLVFRSAADLTVGDTSGEPQVFEYDAQSEQLVRVSVGQAGYSPGAVSADTHSSNIPIQSYAQGAASRQGLQLAVSADGSVVVFGSVGALTPGAVVAQAAGAESAYEYRSTGSIADGDVYLISDGTETHDIEAGTGAGLDASGGDLFFETLDELVDSDGNDAFDLYDARVGGGFPGMSGAGCVGESCQGPVGAGVVPVAPGSVSGVRGGNLPSSNGAPSVVAGGPVPRVLSRAQRLAGALRVCRRAHGHRRRACEAQARKRYRVVHVNRKSRG